MSLKVPWRVALAPVSGWLGIAVYVLLLAAGGLALGASGSLSGRVLGLALITGVLLCGSRAPIVQSLGTQALVFALTVVVGFHGFSVYQRGSAVECGCLPRLGDPSHGTLLLVAGVLLAGLAWVSSRRSAISSARSTFVPIVLALALGMYLALGAVAGSPRAELSGAPAEPLPSVDGPLLAGAPRVVSPYETVAESVTKAAPVDGTLLAWVVQIVDLPEHARITNLTVLDADREPMAHGPVASSGEPSSQPPFVRVGGASVKLPVAVVAECYGYVVQSLTIDWVLGRTSGVARWSATEGRVVQGRVTDIQGEGISGVELLASNRYEFVGLESAEMRARLKVGYGRPVALVRSADDGRFELADWHDDTVALWPTDASWKRVDRELLGFAGVDQWEVAAPDTTGLVGIGTWSADARIHVELARAVHVRIRLVDPDGHDVNPLGVALHQIGGGILPTGWVQPPTVFGEGGANLGGAYRVVAEALVLDSNWVGRTTEMTPLRVRIAAPGYLPTVVDAPWNIDGESAPAIATLHRRSEGQARRILVDVRPPLPERMVGGTVSLMLRDLDDAGGADSHVVAVVLGPESLELAHPLPQGRYLPTGVWVERASATKAAWEDRQPLSVLNRRPLSLLWISGENGAAWNGLAVLQGSVVPSTVDVDEVYVAGLRVVGRHQTDAGVALLLAVPDAGVAVQVVGYVDGVPKARAGVSALPGQTALVGLK